jgi:hypothetical protein
LNCFHIFAIMNNAAINICAQNLCICLFCNNLGYTPNGRIAGSYVVLVSFALL